MKTKEYLNKKMKNETNKTIDRLFKEKLESMEYAINMETTVVYQYAKKFKKFKKLTLHWSLAISFIVVSTVGIYLWNRDAFNLDDKNKTTINNHEPVSINSSSNKLSIIQSEKTKDEQINENQLYFKIPLESNKTLNSAQAPTNLNSNAIIQKQQNKWTSISNNEQIDKSNIKFSSKQSNEDKTYIQSYAHTSFGLTNDVLTEVEVIITPISNNINTKYAEYAPVINADGTTLFYTSKIPIEVTKKKSKLKESIFIATLNETTKKWGAPKLAQSPLNKDLTFTSAVGVSNDGQQLFIYQDDETGNGDIYISKLKGNTWSELQKLPPPINTKDLETTVSLSPDGNTMYIASNRPGGYGGLDLWYSVKNKDGTWQKPVNLGPKINTSGNEEGVFIHPDGKTLYFHSNGLDGFGGYDIFYSTYENGKWSKPVNMGANINEKGNDVYFTIDAAKKTGYFASNRKNGKGETDIYKVEFNYLEKKNNAPSLTLFKGKVLDKQTNKPLEAQIELLDLNKNEAISTLNSNASTGNFMVSLPAGKNYAINVNKNGYLFYSESFLLDTTANYNEVEKIIYLDKLVSGAKVKLNNIFYDYAKATLRTESKTELDKVYELMQQNPNLIIEFAAHTDSRSSDEFNLALSQKRAQSCVDYLINKGIDNKRLIAKGYGETQLVIPDEQINKMSTEAEKEAAHQQNRRTEIKIIKNEN